MSNNQSIALVIGGTTGMGKATAERLLQRGVSVGIVGRNTDRLEATRKELSGLGGVETFQVDLYNTAAVQTFVEQINSEARAIRYLVNAAKTPSPIRQPHGSFCCTPPTTLQRSSRSTP